MKLVIDRPYRVTIPDELDSDKLREFLTYRDKSVYFELSKVKRAAWFNSGSDYCQKKIAELEAKKDVCLLKSEDGVLYTYSGLADELSYFFKLPVEKKIDYPEPGVIPWLKVPDKKFRPYQEAAHKNLMKARHGAVSIGTGLGKSLIILHLVKDLGLPAVVMAPSRSIAWQLYNMFAESMGKRYVGMYGDGKKQSNKKIVIAIAASLTRLEEGNKHYEALVNRPVFVSDESHLTPAKTLAKVCLGVMKNCYYRFFFSATQMRTDGAEKLLQGIIGPVVYNMTVQDGVEQGYLAKPVFTMFEVTSDSKFSSKDANKMDRKHLLVNPMVIRNAAFIANKAWEENKAQTLILIDEFEQAALLDTYLTVPREFAHGGLRTLSASDRAKNDRNPGTVKDPKDFLPEKFHKSDVVDQVKRFNEGKIPILIGTSAISLGTDIQTARVLIFIQKGVSEIKFKQGVGRGTRKVPGKEICSVFDFDVVNKDIVHRHSLARADIYRDIIGDVKFVNLGGKNGG